MKKIMILMLWFGIISYVKATDVDIQTPRKEALALSLSVLQKSNDIQRENMENDDFDFSTLKKETIKTLYITLTDEQCLFYCDPLQKILEGSDLKEFKKARNDIQNFITSYYELNDFRDIKEFAEFCIKGLITINTLAWPLKF